MVVFNPLCPVRFSLLLYCIYFCFSVPNKTISISKSLLQSPGSCAVLYLNFEPAKLQIFLGREFCREGMGIRYLDREGMGMKINIFGNGNGSDCMGIGGKWKWEQKSISVQPIIPPPPLSAAKQSHFAALYARKTHLVAPLI